MKGKIICALSGLFVSVGTVLAQTPVYPVFLTDGISSEAVTILNNRLDNAFSQYGFGFASSPERIALSISCNVTENHVVPSSPTRVSKKMDLVLKIGDVVDNQVFASVIIPLSGIGRSDNKAIIAAFSSVSSENHVLAGMLSNLEGKMADYYSSHSKEILNNARTKAMTGSFDEAIAYLVTVPSVDKSCYSECQSLAVSFYAEKVNEASREAYENALAAWVSSKDRQGASLAVSYLKKVDPASEAYPEALQLWREVSDKLDADEQAERAHAQQVYEDKVDFRNRILDTVRAIGVAFGEHQAQSITKFIKRW